MESEPKMAQGASESRLHDVSSLRINHDPVGSTNSASANHKRRFGIGLRDSKRPQFASGYLLLALALQHGALFGVETVEDLANYDLSSGKPIELRWKDEYLKKPVLRNVTAAGPQDVPLHAEKFAELLTEIVTTAGYSKNMTIHKIRKFLGSVIESRAIGLHNTNT